MIVFTTNAANLGVANTWLQKQTFNNGIQIGTSTTANWVLTADSSGNGTWQAVPSATVSRSNTGIVSGQTTNQTLATITPTADTTYMVTLYGNCTAFTSGQILFEVTYTDETGSAQTQRLRGLAAGTGGTIQTGMGTVSSYYFFPFTFRAKANNAVSIIEDGTYSATWDAAAAIIKITD